jgi:hypothetical protein
MSITQRNMVHACEHKKHNEVLPDCLDKKQTSLFSLELSVGFQMGMVAM